MVNVVLTPDADAADGNWKTQTGGTSLFEVLDEPSPNDSDFIISGADPTQDIVKIRLSDPAGLINQPMTVQVRSRRAGWSAVNLTTRLVEGTTTRATWTDSLTQSWQTYSHELTEAELATITDFTDLYVEMEANLVPEICLAARYVNMLLKMHTPWEEHQGGNPVGSQNNLQWVNCKIEVPVSTADYGFNWYEERYGTANTPVVEYPGATIDPALITALDGTQTACKIVEAADDIPPTIAAKPSPWNLGGYPLAWKDMFWDKAVAVIPAWEGTGDPAYYGAGGAQLGTCVPHSSSTTNPEWGTVTGHGACLSLGRSDDSNTPDWRIPAVAGEDIVPTDKVTICVVQRIPTNGVHCSGLNTTTADGFELQTNTQTGGNYGMRVLAGSAYLDGFDGLPPANELKVWVMTWGPTRGTCLYEYRPEFEYQPIYNTLRVATPLARQTTAPTRAKTAADYRLNMGRRNSRESYSYGTSGVEILFYAILNDEWTAEQARVWMLDPYAPIREGNTRPTHPALKNYHYVVAASPQAQSGEFSPGVFGPYLYRYTMFAKAGERKRLTLRIGEACYANQSNGIQCTFDLENGTIAVAPHLTESKRVYETTSWTAEDVSMVPFSAGWYKLTLDFKPPWKPNAQGEYASSVMKVSAFIDAGEGNDAENIFYAGDGSSGLYIWRTNMLPQPAFEQITTLAFEDDFDDIGTIDVANSANAGFNWYVDQVQPIFDDTAYPPPEGRISVANSVFSQVTRQPYAVPGTDLANPSVYTQNQGLMSFRYKGGETGTGSGLLAENWVGRGFKFNPAMVQVRVSCDMLPVYDPTEPEYHGIPGTFTLSNSKYTNIGGGGDPACSHGNNQLVVPCIWTVPVQAMLSPCPGGSYPGLAGSNVEYVEWDFLEWPGAQALIESWTPVDGVCTGYARDSIGWYPNNLVGSPCAWPAYGLWGLGAASITPEPGSPASTIEPPQTDLSGLHTFTFLFLQATATLPQMEFAFMDGIYYGGMSFPDRFKISNDHHHTLNMGGYHSKWDFVRIWDNGDPNNILSSDGVDMKNGAGQVVG